MPDSSEHVALARILADGWGGSLSGPVIELKPGRVWRVVVDGCACILKNWGPKDAGLEERVGFYQGVMGFVAARSVAVEHALPSRGGHVIHRADADAWWLVRTLPNDPRPLSHDEGMELQRDYGRAIAELHRALALYPQEDARRRTWRKAVRDEVIQHDLPAIRVRLAGADRTRFENDVGVYDQEIAERLEGLPEQLIFFDCHHGNILRVGARISGFVDADHLSIGLRIWDLSYLCAQGLLHIETDGPELWSRHAWMVVDGYHALHPLDERERSAIWHLMAAFRLNTLAGVLAGSNHVLASKLLDQLTCLRRVRPFFP
jgi:Ser/Thr protein kinase RdoA (MazF antagonist)